ncbi:Protein of unknown function [Pyronema omphalodes CBS 100304]|uniref:Uncharacterized protein n=1 Tax=Pyronema omphalodes (strain CBS 100304) TaxID=1076935 RepID=U4LQE1_PYROM|nr:Protein of unknown function [Pyronema omphalodes CBS 100304]
MMTGFRIMHIHI